MPADNPVVRCVFELCRNIFAGFQVVLNVKKGYEGVQELIVQIEA